ncbi:hypothetical protein BH20ACT3_BH20ACT3_03870 [soil metagenome]
MGVHHIERDGTVGPAARPVAVPDDVDDPTVSKASGMVELPRSVRWSHPRRSYDLDIRSERLLVYEQVLTEGGEEDIRRFVQGDILLDLWDELVLPEHVRRAWATWIAARRAHDGG